MRPSEARARDMIASALNLHGHRHDEGSMDGMYDLRVGPAEALKVAIEVVVAIHSAYARTRTAGPGWGPAKTHGHSDWLLFLEDGTVAERLRRKADTIVRRLEQAGWHRSGSHDALRAMPDDGPGADGKRQDLRRPSLDQRVVGSSPTRPTSRNPVTDGVPLVSRHCIPKGHLMGGCAFSRGHAIAWVDSQARRSPHAEGPIAVHGRVPRGGSPARLGEREATR